MLISKNINFKNILKINAIVVGMCIDFTEKGIYEILIVNSTNCKL